MTTKGLGTYGTSPVLLHKPKNTIIFLASEGDGKFFVVGRGMFGMIERDTEVQMPSRAHN